MKPIVRIKLKSGDAMISSETGEIAAIYNPAQKYRVYLSVRDNTGKEMSNVQISILASSALAENMIEQLNTETYILMPAINRIITALKQWYYADTLFVWMKEPVS